MYQSCILKIQFCIMVQEFEYNQLNFEKVAEFFYEKFADF